MPRRAARHASSALVVVNRPPADGAAQPPPPGSGAQDAKPGDAFESYVPLQVLIFVMFGVRMISAVANVVNDCDEIFNYYEPLHYLTYGSGLQTWEYSPRFALRSYAYLFTHMPFSFIASQLMDKVSVFYTLRVLLGLVCAVCETVFLRSISNMFGFKVTILSFLFLAFSPGMFVSSTTFVPSTTCMYLMMLAFAFWLRGYYKWSIVMIALLGVLAWPFAAFAAVPLLIDIVRRLGWRAIRAGLIAGVVISVISVAIDSLMYGRLVFPALNIVLYNVLHNHSNLYGVEGPDFYFRNLMLNFNVVLIFGLLALPILVVVGLRKLTSYELTRYVIALSPPYLWIAFMSLAPHKEERFLFVIYPLLCFNAAVAVTAAWVAARNRFPTWRWFFTLCVVSMTLLYVVFSLLRTVAVSSHYSAPYRVYTHLANKELPDQFFHLPDGQIKICVGKEWHRFGSSYFLPTDRFEIHFLKSGFGGQLPQPFARGVNGTRDVLAGTRAELDHFNDLNEEEPTRYTDVSECHYIVDVAFEGQVEEDYTAQNDTWEPIFRWAFLDAAKADPVDRAFKVPLMSVAHVPYRPYTLLRRRGILRTEAVAEQARQEHVKRRLSEFHFDKPAEAEAIPAVPSVADYAVEAPAPAADASASATPRDADAQAHAEL